MNREHIYNKLHGIYNEFTSLILTNTILEFQKLFEEKYYNTDTVIKSVIEIIPKGIVVYDDKDEEYRLWMER